MGFNFNDLNSLKLDALKEVSNIGAGNAATALSKLTNRRVDMGVPVIKILEFKDVGSILGNEEKLVASVLINVTGNISGMLVLILESRDTISLIEILTGVKYESIENISVMAKSCISETGNILAGAYMAALASMTGLEVKCSYPEVIIDMAAAVISFPAILISAISENVLYIDSKFGEGVDSINANIFLVPEGESFEKLLNALGVW